MVKEASLLMEEGEGLLSICQELHMNANYTSDTLTYYPEKKSRYIKILSIALHDWIDTDSKYDKVVKDLLMATLCELKKT